MSRFGASPRLCPPAGGRLGRHAVWGKEGILPPASVSSSQWFARVFSVLYCFSFPYASWLRLACLRSPPSHNPLSRFHDCFRGVASATEFSIARLRRRSSFSHGRPSGNVRGSNANALDPPSRSRAISPPWGKEETAGMLPAKNKRRIFRDKRANKLFFTHASSTYCRYPQCPTGTSIDTSMISGMFTKIVSVPSSLTRACSSGIDRVFALIFPMC